MIAAVSCSYRRGISLIELLVVIAILGLLAVTVLPNLSNTAEYRRSREAARMVSSYVAKSHSRAIGRKEWSGFTIVASNTTSSLAGTDLFLSHVPPVYRGDTVPALLAITGSVNPTVRTATGISGQLSSTGMTAIGNNITNVRANDLIRFDGRGPWYEVTGTTTGTSLSFRFRGSIGTSGTSEQLGQTSANTPWPPFSEPLAPVGSGTQALSFEILRQPIVEGSPLLLGEGRAIDLRWSGWGPPYVASVPLSESTYRYFSVTPGSASNNATAGASTSILFDGTGRLRQFIVQSGTTTVRNAATGAVFLLIGRTDRVGQDYQPSLLTDADGANWQYPDSYWVGIDPMTGVAKTAECTASATTVIQSQEWIRRALQSGN